MKKIIIIICLLALTGCGQKKEKLENDIVNINEEILKTQTVEDIEFDNTTVIYSNGMTNFNTTIKNNGADKKIDYIFVSFKTKNDILLEQFKIPVLDTLNSKDNKIITMSTDVNLTNAYKITYEIGELNE